MTKTQFRGLLTLWAALILCRLLAPSGGLPDGVRAAMQASMNTFIARPAGLLVILGTWIVVIVGASGMFLMRRGAPYLFIAASLLSLAITPMFGWYAATGWQLLFEGFAWILSGALFVLAVAGPARDFFDRDPHATA